METIQEVLKRVVENIIIYADGEQVPVNRVTIYADGQTVEITPQVLGKYPEVMVEVVK